MLATFTFENEKVLNIFRVITPSDLNLKNNQSVHDNKPYLNPIKLAKSYMNNRKKLEQGGLDEMDDDRWWLKTEFPYFIVDDCLIVTDKNVYVIELT